MAKFGEEHSFKYIGIKKFFRLPITFGKNNFWVNIGRNSVVKVHEQKLLHTWTLTHPHSFTCPVVYEDDEESLCCIIDENTLIKWSTDDDTLNSAMKVKFQETAFAIIPIPQQKSLIIFSSGRFICVEKTLLTSEPRGQAILEPGEELIWADAVAEKEIFMYCLGFFHETNLYRLHNLVIDKETQSAVNYICCSISHESSVLRNWCLNRYNFTFITIWSDGAVISHKTEDQSQCTLLSIPNAEQNSILAIDVVDLSHIIAAKTNLKSKESVLEIWDSKFSVLKARKVLKAPCSDYLQVLVLNYTLFLRSNEDLICIPFTIEKSTLSVAISKSIVDASQVQEFSLDGEGKLVQSSEETQNILEAMDTTTTKETLDSVELVVQKLMKENSEYLKYIPESELVRLLLLSVRCLAQKNVEKSAKHHSNVILCIVFSTSFSDVFLVKYLKKLNLEDTMIALNALLSFLYGSVDISSYQCKKPSDLQIFNWTCLIIQSHMEALSFSKDKTTTKLLRNLMKALSDKMKDYEDFEDIQNYFYIMNMKKNILPEKSTVGKYCIENLNV